MPGVDAERPRRVMIGRFVGVSGIRGQLKFESYTEPRTAAFQYRPWWLVQRGEECLVEPVELKPQGKGLVSRIANCDSRDAAERWVGAEVWVDRAVLPPASDDQFYWVDLEGLTVVHISGQVFGLVKHLFATGANDVMVVQGDRERLLPFVMGAVVRSVDLDERRIVVDWDPDF
ncbi:MAG: Ribosome maturation factor RimM [Alphaproteobacteria bacterium ADurb.BinA280]|jgi:16S rRNA processing protein RimM|nr:MAG: Ribosome maturation factor RimM [Alphaproteobacteria bacterium ADurb.BinA280]